MEFVYSAVDTVVPYGLPGGTIRLLVDDRWFADDPFVIARPDLFSATPQIVHSTVGRDGPGATAIVVTKPVKARRG
jgi:hypothetical protein